eukprot:CAMPEP_0201230680 /NCGR_PEP_ID=MMETSP0852-20130820/2192_1 /ASSEMBLY_ACC=CAM_ASM_000632 /TAXON_ID=183588 /ORGANISM="Pseudo-nitzschia fraudulenta, Strain WWA7" /LENGTH=322 /DNA_ID=CAMNT_0047521767 /DNA_START=492 /DNA_END=1458 /DNA_ORIENTATION=-
MPPLFGVAIKDMLVPMGPASAPPGATLQQQRSVASIVDAPTSLLRQHLHPQPGALLLLAEATIAPLPLTAGPFGVLSPRVLSSVLIVALMPETTALRQSLLPVSRAPLPALRSLATPPPLAGTDPLPTTDKGVRVVSGPSRAADADCVTDSTPFALASSVADDGMWCQDTNRGLPPPARTTVLRPSTCCGHDCPSGRHSHDTRTVSSRTVSSQGKTAPTFNPVPAASRPNPAGASGTPPCRPIAAKDKGDSAAASPPYVPPPLRKLRASTLCQQWGSTGVGQTLQKSANGSARGGPTNTASPPPAAAAPGVKNIFSILRARA